MKATPILYGAPMVRAWFAGLKTQTRRVVRWPHGSVQPGLNLGFSGLEAHSFKSGAGPRYCLMSRGEGGAWQERTRAIKCPYGQPGDALWGRETFRSVWMAKPERGVRDGDVVYRADGYEHDHNVYGPWRPSIFMPRWASRIRQVLTGVRMERLTAISDDDAIAEGVVEATGGMWSAAEGQAGTGPRAAYALLWKSIHGPNNTWDNDTWVWVLTFERYAP